MAIGVGRMSPHVGGAPSAEDLSLASAALQQGLSLAQKASDARSCSLINEHLGKLHLLQVGRRRY